MIILLHSTGPSLEPITKLTLQIHVTHQVQIKQGFIVILGLNQGGQTNRLCVVVCSLMLMGQLLVLIRHLIDTLSKLTICLQRGMIEMNNIVAEKMLALDNTMRNSSL